MVKLYEANLATFSEVVADAMEVSLNDGESFGISIDEWKSFAKTASLSETKEKVKSLGLSINSLNPLPTHYLNNLKEIGEKLNNNLK